MFKSIASSCLALIWLLSAPPTQGQCIALSVQQPGELRSTRSLTLRPSSISSHAIPSITQREYREEPLDELRSSLGEKLRLNLVRTGLFRSVESTKDDASASSALILDVELTYIWQGSRSTMVPLVARSDPSVLEISGTLTTGDAALTTPVLEFICRGSTGGAIPKSKEWMHENIDKVAEGLSKLLMSISREQIITAPALTAAYSQSPTPLEMVLSFPPTSWAEFARALQRGLGHPGPKSPLSASQTIVSPVNTGGTVIGVRVRMENADRLLLIYSRVLSTNKRSISPRLEGTYITAEKLKQIFRDAENSKERIFWVWYAKQGPTYWEKDTISASTSLLDQGSELKPIRTLIPAPYTVEHSNWDSIDSAWTYNSAVFIFPGRHSEASGPGLELHTQLDNHLVRVRF